jgi:hypothetical protein
MTPLWRSNGQCCPNLRSDSPRMSQYVVWAKPQNRPTEAVQRVDSLHVVLEHPAASMVIAFVLNAQPPLRIGEIEPCTKRPRRSTTSYCGGALAGRHRRLPHRRDFVTRQVRTGHYQARVTGEATVLPDGHLYGRVRRQDVGSPEVRSGETTDGSTLADQEAGRCSGAAAKRRGAQFTGDLGGPGHATDSEPASRRGDSACRRLWITPPLAHNPAAQHDAPWCEQHTQLAPRIIVVDHQVGQATLDQPRQTQPLPGPP